jgi:hypothetical protein
VPEEQEILEAIYKLRDRGFGPRKIANEINSLYDVKPFTHSKIQRILGRKFQGLRQAA